VVSLRPPEALSGTLAAARQAADGLGPDEVAATARRYAELTGSFFALADPDAVLAGVEW
jgi:hypothetical protein